MKLQTVLWHFDPFCPQTDGQSRGVSHIAHTHTHTHTLWGELAAHPGTVEEPKGDTPESLPSQCQRAEREKRQSTPVTDATAKRRAHTQTHTDTHTHSIPRMTETNTLCGILTARAHQDSERPSCNVLLTGGMIFWYFIDLFSLSAPPQRGVSGGRQTDTSVGGFLPTWKIQPDLQLKDGLKLAL